MVLLVGVIEHGRACHLDLAQAQVHGDRLGDVQEAAVAANGKRKAVQRLQNVCSLVDIEQARGYRRTLLSLSSLLLLFERKRGIWIRARSDGQLKIEDGLALGGGLVA